MDPYAGTGVRDLYKQLSEMLGPQMGQGVTPYPGQMVPGVSPIQEQGFGLAGGLGPMVSGQQQYFQQMLGQVDPSMAGRGMGMAEGGLQDMLAPFDPASATEFWETAHKQPALEMWREDIMPSIMEKGVRTAGTSDSGPMQRELARSGEDLATGLSGQLANLLFSGEQAQMGRQQAGVGQAMQLAGMPSNLMQGAGQVGGMGTDILSQMLNMGGMQRGITGQQLGAEQQRWESAQPWANPYLQNFLGMGLGEPPMEIMAQGQGPGMGSMLMGGLGSFLGTDAGAGMLAGGLGGLFGGGGGAAAASLMPAGLEALAPMLMFASDERVKENVKTIDNALDKVAKLTGYSFNYTFDTPINRNGGVMAQDLEKVLPDAVTEINGVKFVRIDAVVGLLVNAVNELNEKIGSN